MTADILREFVRRARGADSAAAADILQEMEREYCLAPDSLLRFFMV